MSPLIAMQIVIDAVEKLHQQPNNTKQEIIRNEQALATLNTLIQPKTTEDSDNASSA